MNNQVNAIVPVVSIVNNHTTTTSQNVADVFGKEHKNVLRAIEQLEVPDDFNRLNFEPVDYIDSKGEKRPMFNLTRDGFTILVMGFSGKKAMEFKLAYLEAFNRMEEAIRISYLPKSKRPKPPKQLRIPKVDWTAVAQEEMHKLQDPVLINTHYRIICEFCHKIKPECYEFKSVSRPHYLCPKCVVQKATNKKASIVQPLEEALSFLNVDFLLRDVRRKVRGDEEWAKFMRKVNKILQQRMITEG